jgi:hypothetical protein
MLSYRETVRRQADEESAALASLEKQMPNARILAAICDDNLQRIEKLFTGMALVDRTEEPHRLGSPFNEESMVKTSERSR